MESEVGGVQLICLLRRVDRTVGWVGASKEVYGIQDTVIRMASMFPRVGMSDMKVDEGGGSAGAGELRASCLSESEKARGRGAIWIPVGQEA